ncbi:hypothetical protein NW768_003339 [Fusarium equiseti]|uniref:Uncharacterized protein n=1 Tax=Fusarium equiseti TaxID=61235 RepID=A0ABQ8RLL2_FUSEQ|nr:hypothetical protein NW768_003339 [Fusarium equiseti]
MGLFSKSLRRRRHRAGPEVDLLSAAFGLPFHRGMKPACNKNPARMRVVYAPDTDSSDESESDEPYSSSSEDERGRQQHRGRNLSRRPPTPHRIAPASPGSSKKSPTRKKQHRRRHSGGSSRFSRRKSIRSRTSRSTSRRSNVSNMTTHPPIPLVQSSATFPPRIPVYLSKPPCNIVQSKSLPIPTLSHPFGVPVCQPIPQQQVYYHNPINFGQPQPNPMVRVQTPQFINPAMPPHVVAQPPPGLATVPVTSTIPDNNVASPETCNTSTPEPESQATGAPNPWAKDIQRLQKHIDAKMADLSSEPDSRVLRRDLRRLQDRLNSTLNKAIKCSKMHTKKPSLGSVSSFSQSTLGKNIPGGIENTPVHGAVVYMSTIADKQQRRYHAQQAKSPQRIPRHHVCSGCGNVRSQQFHKRWPLDNTKKSPKISYCESCREEMYNRGIVQKYHFCFNCGGARSMAFHREHPVLPGEPIFVNYCGSCTEEFKVCESLPDTSVLNIVVPRVDAYVEVATPSDSEEDLDSLVVNRHQNCKNDKYKVRSEKRHEVKPKPKQQQRDSSVETPRGRRRERRTPRVPIVASNDDLVSPESPYCPSRSTSSSDRRAERKLSGQLNSDSSTNTEEVKVNGNYQSPYVEDSSSSHHSRVATPTPSLRSKKRDLKVEPQAHDSRKDSPADFVLKSALAGGERSSSDGSRKARAEISEGSPTVRENSLDSDRSDPSSSKSSGSKTVRFKQSVDIRTALPHDGDDFSESESPRYPRAPGSPLISRKKSAPHNTRETNDKYLHPHYGQPSMVTPGFHREHLHVPDSYPGTPSVGFSKGAFSKDFDGNGHWDTFSSPRYSYADQYSENSCRSYYGADEDLETSTPRPYNYDQYGESSTSLPSRLSPGSIFSSFFKKDKASSVPPGNRERFGPRSFTDSQTTPCPQRSQCSSNIYTSFTEPELRSCTDQGSATETGSGVAANNPYYTPRKRSHPEASYCGSPTQSEKSFKCDHESSSSTKSDKLIWKNAFNPIPTVEEPGTIGDSSPESPTDLLEFNVVIDFASPVGHDIDMESLESHSSTSDN